MDSKKNMVGILAYVWQVDCGALVLDYSQLRSSSTFNWQSVTCLELSTIYCFLPCSLAEKAPAPSSEDSDLRSADHWDLLAYDHYLSRSFSLTNIRPFELFPHDLYLIRYFGIRSLSDTIFFCLRTFAIKNIIPYELYPVRSFGIRTLSLRSSDRKPAIWHKQNLIFASFWCF